jgi:hypothetical protein
MVFLAPLLPALLLVALLVLALALLLPPPLPPALVGMGLGTVSGVRGAERRARVLLGVASAAALVVDLAGDFLGVAFLGVAFLAGDLVGDLVGVVETPEVLLLVAAAALFFLACNFSRYAWARSASNLRLSALLMALLAVVVDASSAAAAASDALRFRAMLAKSNIVGAWRLGVWIWRLSMQCNMKFNQCNAADTLRRI